MGLRLQRAGTWAVKLLAVLLCCTGCVTRPISTATSSDVRLYQEHLQRPPWLEEMSEDDIHRTVEQALQTPVDFHGVVVDEAGEPVSGAAVTFALFDQKLDPFEFPYVGWTMQPEVKSGLNGRFSLTGAQGTALYVRVQKDGYRAVGNSKRHLRYAPRMQYLNEYPLPTADAPMRFVLTPGLPLEGFFVVDSGGIPIPRGGSEIGFWLDQRDPYGVAPEKGHFAFSCDKGPERDDGRWDWSCRIRMKEGSGIQLRQDLVLLHAPEDGYQPVYEWGFDADDPDWDHRDERFVYIRLEDGRYYGHLTFKVRTAGDYFFDVDGMVNLTGSRELEILYHNYHD